MRKTSFTSFSLLLILALSAGLAFFSCSQYEYASPTPGILEVRLKVKNSRTDLIPFGPLNGFGVTMRSLEATMPGDIHLRILSDLNAIRRKPEGDTLNCLALAARDSQLVLGRVYAPPMTYTGLELNIRPDPFLFVTTGLIPSFIELRQPNPAPPALQRLPAQGNVLNITVNEGRTTLVTVTLDLDSTLVRRTEWFEYNPLLYVSSIQSY